MASASGITSTRADLTMRELQHGFSRSLSRISRRSGAVIGRRLSAGGPRRAAVRRHRRRLLHHPGIAAAAAARHPAGARSLAVVSGVETSGLGGPTLSGRSRIAGVMGWPVAHSRSPRLHGYWLRTYGIDGAYIPLPVRPEQFAAALRALPMLGFAGANVTVPHKEAALSAVDRSDSTARRIGAVNTIVVAPDGTLDGRNSDGFGFMENLRAGVPGWSPMAGPAVIARRRRRGPRDRGRAAGWRRAGDPNRESNDRAGRTLERGYRRPVPRLWLGRTRRCARRCGVAGEYARPSA